MVECRHLPHRRRLGTDAAHIARQRRRRRNNRPSRRTTPQTRQRLHSEPGSRRPHGLLFRGIDTNTVGGVRSLGSWTGRLQADSVRSTCYDRVYHVSADRDEHRQISGENNGARLWYRLVADFELGVSGSIKVHSLGLTGSRLQLLQCSSRNSFSRIFTSLSRTAFTDYRPDRFF